MNFLISLSWVVIGVKCGSTFTKSKIYLNSGDFTIQPDSISFLNTSNIEISFGYGKQASTTLSDLCLKYKIML